MTSRHDTQLGRATCRPGTRTAHNNTSGKKIERKTRCFFYSSRRCRPCVSVGLAVGLYAADNHLNISTIAVVVGRVPLSCQTGCSCQLSQHSLPSPPPPPPPLPPPPLPPLLPPLKMTRTLTCADVRLLLYKCPRNTIHLGMAFRNGCI